MTCLYVVIATVGRASLTRKTVDLLGRQTRKPDGIMVVSVTPADVIGVAQSAMMPEIVFSEKGLCRQRNKSLDLLTGKADLITFLDDDFVAADDYLEQVDKLFLSPNVVGVTGELIADGINGTGFTIEEAQTLLAQHNHNSVAVVRDRASLYGCNMSIRMAAADGLRFEEALPLYGWQEDVDFTFQLSQRGRLVSSSVVTGVHMGTKAGRTSGKRLGYSQIANILYLRRKGTIPRGLGERLLTANLLANMSRSFWPERHVDRRGRLWGNMIAIADLFRGKLDPRRIETM